MRRHLSSRYVCVYSLYSRIYESGLPKPTGTLVPSKSNLQVFACWSFVCISEHSYSHLKLKKEDLQDTVRRLQTRSRALETALRDVYGHVSSSPHHLLRDGGMFSGNSLPSFAPQNAGEDEVDDLLDAFGSLAIGDNGQAIYHAASSSAEVSTTYLGHSVASAELCFSICSAQ